MTLEDYRIAHRMTYQRLALMIGFGLSAKEVDAARRYALQRALPPPSMIRRIRNATNGAVTAEDFVDQCIGAKRGGAR